MRIEDIRAKLLTDRASLVAEYESELARVDDALHALGGSDNGAGVPAPTVAIVRKRSNMSKAARAAVSARMRKYWADRKRKGK